MHIGIPPTGSVILISNRYLAGGVLKQVQHDRMFLANILKLDNSGQYP